MQPTAHIKGTFSSEGEYGDVALLPAKLLLHVGRTHFSYAFSNTADMICYRGFHKFHAKLEGAELTAQLETIFLKDGLLKRTAGAVKVLWEEEYEIVPRQFYDGELETNSLLKKEDAAITFDRPHAVKELLENQFGHLEHSHAIKVLADAFRSERQWGNYFVHVNEAFIDVILFDDGGKLRIANTYEYHSVNDFMYFVLLVANEWKLDRENTILFLAGEIEKASPVFEKAAHYFKEVVFAKDYRHFLMNKFLLCA